MKGIHMSNPEQRTLYRVQLAKNGGVAYLTRNGRVTPNKHEAYGYRRRRSAQRALEHWCARHGWDGVVF
jgi:hypothetical protein